MKRVRFRPKSAHLVTQGIIIAIALAAFANRSDAQTQQAWVAHYNNGITNGQHQALKMALGGDGNVYVCGFSQNANSNLDYAILKYAPNGNLVWVSRLDSSNMSGAKPTAFSLDISNNSVITGNAGTVKFDSNGRQIWQASYSGHTVATDLAGCAYVGGYSKNFAVTKLSPDGTNLWTTSYVDVGGPTISQSVIVDRLTNVCVSGLDSYNNPSVGPPGPYVYLTTIKYSGSGKQLWKSSLAPEPQFTDIQVEAAATDSQGNVCIAAFFDPGDALTFYYYTPAGTLLWSNGGPDLYSGPDTVRGLAFDKSGLFTFTGQFVYTAPQYAYSTYAFGTYRGNAAGSWEWTNLYPTTPNPPSAAAALALDSSGNGYVTGYNPRVSTSNDIVTIAYGTNGKQLWLQRYDGPAHGDDEGNAICVDTNGNVYVAGYDTPIGGGTEMVLIKYSPVTVKHEANGDFQLQAQGAASEPFDIQASTNLDTWQDLGDFDADTNGLLQFTDTNASQYDSRFYLAIPQ